MNRHLIALFLAGAWIIVSATASAQTVRRCVGPAGVPFYTDAACPDATRGDVIRHDSPEGRTARQQREADNYVLAQQRAQADTQRLANAEARTTALLAERDVAIDASVNGARQREAAKNAEESHDKTQDELLRAAQGGRGISARERREARAALVDLEETRAAQATGSLDAIQQAAAGRDVRQAKARADDADERARAAEAAAQRAENEARQPKYDGNRGVWCESPAPGVTNCHP